MPFSRTKPRIAPPCASDLAQTTNTSAIGALVIQVLLPAEPIAAVDLLARVRMPPGSEPASGSVRPKQPIHSPRRELRQVLLRCSFRAVGVDRVHHEATTARSSSSDSPNRPARPRARPGRRRHSDAPAPPYSSGMVAPEQAELAHLAEDRGVGRSRCGRPRSMRGAACPAHRPARCRGSSARLRSSWSSRKKGSAQSNAAMLLITNLLEPSAASEARLLSSPGDQSRDQSGS